MIVHIPKPPKGPITCAFCPDEAASVCNSRTPSFIGCNRPFCSSHGIPHDISQLEIKQALKAESDIDSLSRYCRECLPRDPSSEQSFRPLLKFGVIWATFSLFFAFLAIGSLLKPTDVTCREGTLLKITNQKCMRTRNLTVQEHTSWYYFQNEDLEDCASVSSLSSNSTMLAMKGGLPQLLPVIQIRCRCPDYQTGSFRYIKYGEIVRFGSCAVGACSPNGKSWLTNFGSCYTIPIASPDYEALADIGCPIGTYFNEEFSACTMPMCPSQNYFLNLKEARCRMCPLFTFSQSFKRACSRTYVTQKMDHFKVFEHPYLAENRVEPCSVESNPDLSSGARLPNREERDSIYRPRVVDQFGYWQCPTKFDGRINRTCQTEEMLIRYTVGCQSPCKPCLEKWDFALKKCVPADTHCLEAGLVLITSGECSRGSENQLRYLLQEFGESNCEL